MFKAKFIFLFKQLQHHSQVICFLELWYSLSSITFSFPIFEPAAS